MGECSKYELGSRDQTHQTHVQLCRQHVIVLLHDGMLGKGPSAVYFTAHRLLPQKSCVDQVVICVQRSHGSATHLCLLLLPSSRLRPPLRCQPHCLRRCRRRCPLLRLRCWHHHPPPPCAQQGFDHPAQEIIRRLGELHAECHETVQIMRCENASVVYIRRAPKGAKL